jgi:hypothetical protein
MVPDRQPWQGFWQSRAGSICVAYRTMLLMMMRTMLSECRRHGAFLRHAWHAMPQVLLKSQARFRHVVSSTS